MAIQIGKYKRPGIFIEEFDNSVIVSPTVTGVSSLVVGFSKKGPANTPVFLQTTQDLESIFGPLDRNLERKGSFFHRTVSKMLESSPVFAMNLLSTSDTLDLIEYKSVSTSTDKTNDVVREGAYRRFFDTTGFWKRDTDSFINLTSDDLGAADRLLSFTNMSDKYITIFVFKSRLTGFNRTLLEWYGSADKVPSYVNQLDYASDYLVDVLVVGGDWSNYQQLAVDTKWSAYFTSQGLMKDQVQNFANDRNVNLLQYYEGLSLIPFFRDSNGRNIFIETIINNDTDRTGLFCSFDMDKFEKDFPTGMVDLIGNNLVVSEGLVNNGQVEIDFLSYNVSIIESLDYTATPLDIAGGSDGQNLVAMGPSVSLARSTWGGVNRTAHFSEEYINGVTYETALESLGGSQSLQIGYTLTNPSLGSLTASEAYIVTAGNKVLVNSGTAGSFTYSILSSNYTVSSQTASYTSVVHINSSTGEITLTNGTVDGINPTIPSSDIVLTYIDFQVANGEIIQSIGNTPTVTEVGVNELTDPSPITFLFGGTSSGVPVESNFVLNLNGSQILSTTASSDVLDNFLNSVYLDFVGANVTGYSATVSTLGLSSSLIITPDAGSGALYNGDIFTNTLLAGSASITVSSSSQTISGGVDGGFNELDFGVDFDVTEISAGKIRVEFLGTSGTDTTNNYEKHRKIRLFNFFSSMLENNLSQMTMLKDLVTLEKFSLANATISNVVVSTTANKSFDLELGLTSTPADILAGNLVFYKIDNELVLGPNGVTTTSLKGSPTASGVVGKFADLYNNFYNGQINTGDYFYPNLIESSYPNSSIRVVFQNEGTYSYIVFSDTMGWNVLGNEQVNIPDSTLNTGIITLDGDTNYYNILIDPSTGTYYTAGYEAYRVTTNVVDEDITSTPFVYDATTKVYLQMYLDSSNNLTVKFVDSLLTSTEPIDVTKNNIFNVITNKSNYKQTIEIEVPAGYTPIVNKILVNGSRYTEVKVGDFLEAYVDPNVPVNVGEMTRNLTRIISKRVYAPDTTLVEITCDSAIEKYAVTNGNSVDYQTIRYTSMDDYVSTYKAIPLKGFRVREASMPDGTETRQSTILNLIAKGTPLFKALTNKEAIDFRYVVDAFGLGLTERSKQQLVDVCGDRLDCLGFINMPSMKSFKNSTSPSFVNNEGVLQTSFIASGGNLESSPAFLYSFGDGRGASCVGYFLPYVTVNDNGRPADVPPAMYVATTYMRKQNTNVTSIVPWTIAAGVTNGRVTNIAGIEMNYTPEDIENLNGAQMNPIVFKRNRGFVIETENTGQTLYKSALSFLHVREVLIELERELSAMLLEFQWKFNTAEIRAEIKLRADVICEKYVNKNGLYNYFNKCDEENNTPTIIDNQIGVLDTYVEPIKGMGVIVNNITILRTGAISAGGFINQ